MPTNEDEYFKQQDRDKLAESRRAKQLAAIRQQEQNLVQQVLNTSEDVAAEALELGFDSETARILPLIPMIHVAWVDGKVSSAEGKRLETFARDFGIEEGSSAQEFLELLLSEPPSDEFFRRVGQVIAHLIEKSHEIWTSESLISLCMEIAQASGSFFKLRDPVSDTERSLLEDFAAHFGIQHDAAARALPDEEG